MAGAALGFNAIRDVLYFCLGGIAAGHCPAAHHIWGEYQYYTAIIYAAIQAAIHAAEDGDVIYVDDGIYNENLTIDGVDVSLIAPGDATIDGFTVLNGKSGIYARGVSSYGDGPVDVSFINNYVTDYYKNGYQFVRNAGKMICIPTPFYVIVHFYGDLVILAGGTIKKAKNSFDFQVICSA